MLSRFDVKIDPAGRHRVVIDDGDGEPYDVSEFVRGIQLRAIPGEMPQLLLVAAPNVEHLDGVGDVVLVREDTLVNQLDKIDPAVLEREALDRMANRGLGGGEGATGKAFLEALRALLSID